MSTPDASSPACSKSSRSMPQRNKRFTACIKRLGNGTEKNTSCIGADGRQERAARGVSVKMHILSGGRIRLPKSIYVPDASREEMFEVPVSCALLRHPQGNVLFDTGCHPGVTENAEAHWGWLTKFMTPVMKPGDNVITALGEIGLQCDDIDVVVCSHLHVDHCGCCTFFKRATCIIHAKEIAAARAPDAEKVGYFAGEWEQSTPPDAI